MGMENRNALPSFYLFPDKVRLAPSVQQRLVNIWWDSIILGRFHPEVLRDDAKAELGEEYSLSEEDAQIILDSLFTCRRAQIERYKETGDFADMRRLNQAFFELSEFGVLALPNYLCCTSCASQAAFEEMQHGNYNAVLYFHEQDTERLLKYRQTHLGFDYDYRAFYSESNFAAMTPEQKREAFEKHMGEIVEETIRPTFNRYHIDFSWDGNSQTRMLISNVDWLVPLPRE